MTKRYRVEFLFQGLFLLWPTKTKIKVLLPDATGESGPDACYCDHTRPLREHAVFFELPAGAQGNFQDFKDHLIRHTVGQKPEQQFLHWKSTKMRFGVLNKTVYKPADGGPKAGFKAMANGALAVCRGTSATSVDRLMRFADKLHQAPDIAARMDFSVGCAWSERESTTPKGQKLEWIEIPAGLLRAANQAGTLQELIRLTQGLKRPLNLDLRVAMELPAKSDLHLDVPGKKNLKIKAPGAGKTLVFKLRNQEWPTILAESSALWNPKGPVRIDYDQEYMSRLAQKGMQGIAIPVSADGQPLSPGGQACGGSSGGG